LHPYVSIRQHAPAYVSIRQHTSHSAAASAASPAFGSPAFGSAPRQSSCSIDDSPRSTLRNAPFIGRGKQSTRPPPATSAYVSIRQHTRSTLRNAPFIGRGKQSTRPPPATSYVSIRQHMSAYAVHRSRQTVHQASTCYVSLRQHASAYVSIRQHTPFIKQSTRPPPATSAYVSTCHELECTLFVLLYQ